MYRRFLLIACLGLTLSACVPYDDAGSSYYRSEVYTSPAPAYYYGGGSYYPSGGYYAPRYYQPEPRYYQPRYYQPAPRYYQPMPRAVYRPFPDRGWDGHDRHGWGNGGWDRGGRGEHGGHDDHGGRDNHGARDDHGGRDNHDHGDRGGEQGRRWHDR